MLHDGRTHHFSDTVCGGLQRLSSSQHLKPHPMLLLDRRSESAHHSTEDPSERTRRMLPDAQFLSPADSSSIVVGNENVRYASTAEIQEKVRCKKKRDGGREICIMTTRVLQQGVSCSSDAQSIDRIALYRYPQIKPPSRTSDTKIL